TEKLHPTSHWRRFARFADRSSSCPSQARPVSAVRLHATRLDRRAARGREKAEARGLGLKMRIGFRRALLLLRSLLGGLLGRSLLGRGLLRRSLLGGHLLGSDLARGLRGLLGGSLLRRRRLGGRLRRGGLLGRGRLLGGGLLPCLLRCLLGGGDDRLGLLRGLLRRLLRGSLRRRGGGLLGGLLRSLLGGLLRGRSGLREARLGGRRGKRLERGAE